MFVLSEFISGDKLRQNNFSSFDFKSNIVIRWEQVRDT